MGRKEGGLGGKSLQPWDHFEKGVTSPSEGPNELEGAVVIPAK